MPPTRSLSKAQPQIDDPETRTVDLRPQKGGRVEGKRPREKCGASRRYFSMMLRAQIRPKIMHSAMLPAPW